MMVVGCLVFVLVCAVGLACGLALGVIVRFAAGSVAALVLVVVR